jgi:hypothetical protein
MPSTIKLPILGPGVDGRSRAITAQVRQNIFLEVKKEQDKSALVAYGTPGLRLFTDFGGNPSRGMWWFQALNLLYVVVNNELFEVRGDGVSIRRGALATNTGTVSMSDNGQQLIIVDGENGYIFQPQTASLAYSRTLTLVTVTEPLTNRVTGDVVTIDGDAAIVGGNYTITVTGGNEWTFNTAASGSASGTIKVVNNFREITSASTGVDFPGANTVVFLDSYFIINNPGTKQFWLSGQYDGLYWDPLQYASKEAYTDDLQAVTVDNGNLVLLGAISQEYWQNDGGFPFPLSRIAGSPTDIGIAARWSMARCGGQLFYLGRTRRGGLSVVKIQNYQPVVVSTTDLDYLFSQYSNPGDAIAFSYRQNGHEFYQISFQQEGVTWLYDDTTEVWSKLQSGHDTRHYGNRGTQFINQAITADYRTGKLYYLDPEHFTDNGEEIARELITPHFFAADSFNKLHIYRLRLDMEQGTGLVTGQGSNPQIMLQVSRDGGFAYGNEMWTSFGRMGEYNKRAEWRRLGVSRNFVFKFRITDPVKVIFIAAAAMATQADK